MVTAACGCRGLPCRMGTDAGRQAPGGCPGRRAVRQDASNSLPPTIPLDVVTGAFAYLRLLGDREAVDALTPTLDHIVIDRGPEVEADARAIQVLRQRVPVIAFVNNHYAGYAPEAVRQLAALTEAGARA